jgi:hypothetical protein
VGERQQGKGIKKHPGGMTKLRKWLRRKMRHGENGLKIDEKKIRKE